MNPPNEEILSLIPFRDLQYIRIGIESGYSVASALIDSCDFLKVPSAKNRHQDIYNFASDFCIDKQCKEGKIAFDSKFLFNHAHNCKYLQLQNDTVMVTFCSVNSPTALPRTSIFRRDLAYSNQVSMDEILNRKLLVKNPRYFIVTHQRILKNGVYTPAIQIGIPDEEYQKWNNLFSLDETLELCISDKRTVETPPELDISLKEELVEAIKNTLA